MVVYYIANYAITDQNKFDEYAEATRATIGQIFKEGKGKMLVNTHGDGKGVKEGIPQNHLLVVEFESRDIAENWYNSDAYSALIPKRQAATENAWVTITDKFSPPS